MGAAVGKKGPQGDINVTPLVDIVLVLLIIFMVITPLLAKNIPVEVPEKNEQEEPPEQIKDQLVLKLFSNGHIELNRTPVTAEELDQLLHDKVAAGKGAVMFFEADADAVYGQAVALMDLARGAGIGTLGMMTPDEDADATG